MDTPNRAGSDWQSGLRHPAFARKGGQAGKHDPYQGQIPVSIQIDQAYPAHSVAGSPCFVGIEFGLWAIVLQD